MSSLPIADPDGVTCDDPFDEFWSLYQEILLEENPIDHEATKIGLLDFSTHVDQQPHLATREAGENNYNIGLKNSTRNSKRRKRNLMINIGEGPSSIAKKLDHNAKERIRRMKVNASFLALRELLPDHSRKSKKIRLKAPAIVDGALEYIPELEHEIEELISKKENVKSQVKNKKINIDNGKFSHNQSCTVSINKVNERQVVVQICCMGREDKHREGSAFTNLLERVEDEGACIISASTVNVCETRTCYHLHIQMNQISYGAVAELQEKILSWMR